MQTTARRNDWPLDKTVVRLVGCSSHIACMHARETCIWCRARPQIVTEVTKKTPEQIDVPSRDGAYVHGLTLEGARWDDKAGLLEDARPKELFCPMPVRSQFGCNWP